MQVYASRAFGWRGAFADHTWLAAKAQDADHFTRYEVIGWYGGGGRSVVSISGQRAPDAEWFGAPPRLITRRARRGGRGDHPQAAAGRRDLSLRHARTTRGPVRTATRFVAHLGREIAELNVTLPSTAIGKDYLPIERIVSTTPSGTGVQLSLYGVLGVLYGSDEGLELNVLGLVTGIDLRHPALKLPGIGRVPGNG